MLTTESRWLHWVKAGGRPSKARLSRCRTLAERVIRAAEGMNDKTDADLKRHAAELRWRSKSGEDLAGILPEAYALVHQACRRTLGLTNKRLLKAYEHIRTHFHEEVSVRELAAQCRLSVRQFERKFREQVWATPRELIVRMRVQHACDELRESKSSLADIALSSGFYDQSSFTRQFKKHLGITPGQYRRRYG
jgi:AraC-like DNA-binding protein